MDMKGAIRAVSERHDLAVDEMSAVMRAIMTGRATDAQIGGFLIGLRMKGETVEEIAAAAAVMRELAVKVEVDPHGLVDVVGTGGDAAHTFNISTASALVAAGAGAKVAKHGNRAVSGATGAADVLEAAGVHLDLSAAEVAECIAEVGIGFMFAPRHHSAMKHALGPRREMAVRTVFNLLGPLTNPAGAPRQLLGVFAEAWARPIAEVLARLGSEHALVVHSEDGLDEISIAAPTRVVELRAGEISVSRIAPEDFGLARADLASVSVDSVAGSLTLLEQAIDGHDGPARDIVCLNAGAAIYAAGAADTLREGVERARQATRDGSARERLDALVAKSRALGTAGRDAGRC